MGAVVDPVDAQYGQGANDVGSITLTSGIAVDDPIAQGSNAATSNAGIEGFVPAAACDFSRGIRINEVSPTMLTESMDRFGPFFPGMKASRELASQWPIDAALKACRAGAYTGSTIEVEGPRHSNRDKRPELGCPWIRISRHPDLS